MTSSINTMRGVLVGGAGVAALIAAILGLWLTVVVLVVAVVAHGGYWLHLHRRTGPDLATD